MSKREPPDTNLCVQVEHGLVRIVLCANAISLTVKANQSEERGETTLHLSGFEAGMVAGAIEIAAQIFEDAQ